MNEPRDSNASLSIEACVRLACFLEATARKPGNVHPQASFDDLCYLDMLRSAEAIAPVLATSRKLGVGRTVFEAIRCTHETVGQNTNLGIVLLLVPMAAVPTERSLADGISEVLSQLTEEDAIYVYRAIRLSNAGGMGTADEQDVSDDPSETLLEVMKRAAHRDTVAQQYASQFELVLDIGLPFLQKQPDFLHCWEEAIIGLQLLLMREAPDTLIARKCGRPTAEKSAQLAANVLDAGWPEKSAARRKLDELDGWLRADGHRRNPGTTADLVTACLFAALRDGEIVWQC